MGGKAVGNGKEGEGEWKATPRLLPLRFATFILLHLILLVVYPSIYHPFLPSSCMAQQIVSSPTHTCLMNVAGYVDCWGFEEYGVAPAPTNLTAVSLCLGSSHACAINEMGNVTCWGCQAPPEQRGQCDVPAGQSFRQLSCAARRSCAIEQETNQLHCWGENIDAIMPNDTTLQFKQVDVGGASSDVGFVCGILMNDTVICYGDTSAGPTIPPADVNFTYISAGSYHACGLDESGYAHCWGSNTATPPVVGGGPLDLPTNVSFAHVAAEDRYTCAIYSENATLLGVGTNDWLESSPSVLTPTSTFVQTRGGCGVTTNGTAECWGQSEFGTKFPPTAPATYATLHQAYYSVCAITVDGELQCFSTEDGSTMHVPSGALYSSVSVTSTSICALSVVDRHLDCFSARPDGQGSWTPYPPSSLAPDLPLQSFDMGDSAKCAITQENHTIFCWDGIYNLGNYVPGGEGVSSGWQQVSVSTSGYAACALTANSSIHCWGSGCEKAEPEPICHTPQGNDWTHISVGNHDACAVNSLGYVTCWGEDSTSTTLAPPDTRFSTFDIGVYMSVGVLADSKEMKWYSTSSGQEIAWRAMGAPIDKVTVEANAACIHNQEYDQWHIRSPY